MFTLIPAQAFLSCRLSPPFFFRQLPCQHGFSGGDFSSRSATLREMGPSYPPPNRNGCDPPRRPPGCSSVRCLLEFDGEKKPCHQRALSAPAVPLTFWSRAFFAFSPREISVINFCSCGTRGRERSVRDCRSCPPSEPYPSVSSPRFWRSVCAPEFAGC